MEAFQEDFLEGKFKILVKRELERKTGNSRQMEQQELQPGNRTRFRKDKLSDCLDESQGRLSWKVELGCKRPWMLGEPGA